MKILSLPALVLAAAMILCPPARADEEFTALEASLVDRAVVMKLPEGVRRVRLRTKQADGSWKLCTIAHLEGNEGYLKLRLPDGVAEADCDIAASYTDPFPYSFYLGETEHPGTETGNSGVAAPTAGPEQFSDDLTTDPDTEAAVEESDIWKWRGSTLYFFNQYRGLQVIDVSTPAVPERLANLRIPSHGEQLYLHPEEDYVILLTYDSSSGNGEVVLVEHELTHTLQQRQSFPVPGYILESRLIGNILYVVSRHSWQQTSTGPDGVEHLTWRSGLAITKIDLSDPANPVASPPLQLTSDQFNYWGAQVQATSKALLISTNAYDSVRRQSLSTVHVVDISDPSATPVVTHHLPAAGQVLDKYNLHLRGDILTVVSQIWRGTTTRQRYASVETFDLSRRNPKLAEIEFASNESITASRFVGDLLYVVTFFRVDPLFVISLADPARPRILSELEIPGFSTHLEPLGEDALISIGVEGSQIAVSWFDVSDPTDTSLSSRVFIGAEDGWSWTEANWDDKAFGFFPTDGLLLVPYQGSVPGQGWVSGVQLIELGEQELIKRGSFEHEFRARRARVLDDAVVSISGRSLKALDITDRDNPRLLAELTLAWPVDLVHRVGEVLVQLERGPGYWWYGGTDAPARLHVSPVADPDTLLASLELPGGRISGSFLHGDCLFVAQSRMNSQQLEGRAEYTDTFTTTVVDLGDPDRPIIIGRDSFSTTDTSYSYGFGADYKGELLPDGSLVWYPAEQTGYFFWGFPVADSGFGAVPLGGDALYPWFPSSGKVYTVDIAEKTRPKILAAIDLTEESAWPEGEPQLVGSTLYYGVSTNEQFGDPLAVRGWRTRHWLGHLDLADPSLPVRSDLVTVPGTFEHALATPARGTIIFTSRHRYIYEPDTPSRYEYRIQALAFDGIDAFLLDELVTPNSGYGPKVFHDRFVVLAKSDYNGSEVTTDFSTFEWLNSGSFRAVQTVQRAGSIYRLAVLHDLLVAGASGELSFIDFADPTDPDPASISFPNTSFWQRLELIDLYQREFAYVPRGFYGVDALDFGGVFAASTPTPPPSPSKSPQSEWAAVPLTLLGRTSATSGLVLAGLSQGDDWMFDSTIPQYDYESWMRLALGLAPTDPVPAADLDSDHDGESNAWEFFTGTHPGQPGSLSPFRVFLSTSPDGQRFLCGHLTINPHATGSLAIHPELSLDLEQWTAKANQVRIEAEPFHPGVVLRALDPLEKGSRGFLRATLSTTP